MARPSAEAVAALNKLVDGAIEVVERLQALAGEIQTRAARQEQSQQEHGPASIEADSLADDGLDSLDALALAQDAATLVRAHATKISLLAINEPFTPSAVGKVVQELLNGALPALVKSAQACRGERYTHGMQAELATRCQRVLRQTRALLQSVPRDGRVRGAASGPGGNNLTGTGILWSECDAVVALARMGVAGRAVQLVEQLSDTLQDELEELKEWGEQVDNEGDDSGYGEEDTEDQAAEAEDDEQGQDPHATTQALLDDLMDGGRHIPANDPDGLRPRLEVFLRQMRMTRLLYAAIVKRRLRRLPALPQRSSSSSSNSTTNTNGANTLSTAMANADTVVRLDRAVAVVRRQAEQFGDVAEAFYELDAAGVDKAMATCSREACGLAAGLELAWDGQRDEFSNWAARFQTEMNKMGGTSTEHRSQGAKIAKTDLPRAEP